MKLMSVDNMKRLEETANAGGYTFEKMMNRAGFNLAHVVHERFFNPDHSEILGLVGGGNNGGDTLIALMELHNLGWGCSAIIAKPGSQPEELLKKYEKNGCKLLEFGTSESIEEIKRAHVILDGFFGTGFKPPMRKPYDEILTTIGKSVSQKKIVAVDCPSGVDCVTGEASPVTLHANLTVCMEGVKDGLLKFPAFNYCGDLVTVELGIPDQYLQTVTSDDLVIDAELVKNNLPKHTNEGHKGLFGHLIICGGCVNYTGAPILAGKSAYRVGTGLVETAIPERIFEASAGQNLESIWLLLDDEDGVIAESGASTLLKHLKKATCLLIGPGMGQEDTTLKFINRILFEQNGKTQPANVGFLPKKEDASKDEAYPFPPTVIDADGLRLLSKTPDWYKRLKSTAILTPHPGEMSSLTNLPVQEIQNNRIEIARQYASEWKQVLVLKGANTVVASPTGKVAVLPFANASLAKAGTGDVLAGMIAGFAAQGVKPFEAAAIGVWLHAQAAVHAEDYVKGIGEMVIASDLIEYLQFAYPD